LFRAMSPNQWLRFTSSVILYFDANAYRHCGGKCFSKLRKFLNSSKLST
jgi:hypothetical protein